MRLVKSMGLLLNLALFLALPLAVPHYAHAQPACIGSDTLGRIATSVSKFHCANLFVRANGPNGKPASMGSDAAACGELLAFGGVIAGGTAGGAAALRNSINRQRLAYITHLETKEIPQWERLIADTSSQSNIMKGVVDAEIYTRRVSVAATRDLIQTSLAKAAAKKVARTAVPKLFSAFGILCEDLALGAATGGVAIAVDAAVQILTPSRPGCGDTPVEALYVDLDDDCQLEIGEKTGKFMTLSETEQQKIFKSYPQLCNRYAALAETLEKQYTQAFPTPQIQVLACDSNGQVAKVDLKYPNQSHTTVESSGSTINIDPSSSREKYRLDLNPASTAWGVGRVKLINAKVKVSNVSVAYNPNDILKNPTPNDEKSIREITESMKGWRDFETVRHYVGDLCVSRLATTKALSETGDATSTPASN